MTESPLVHSPDSVVALSPNHGSEPLSHTQRRAVVIVSVMAFFVAIACAVAGYLVGYRAGRGNQPIDPGGMEPRGIHACTLEAKICADGSSVGRSGPNCEFAPCPGELVSPPTGVQNY